MNKLKTGKL